MSRDSESQTDHASAFLRPLFRPAALARRGQTEDLDRLLRVTAPHEWVVLAVLAVALVLVLVWGVFGRIERSVTAECVLVESGEMHPVMAESEGSVAAVLVAAGEEVQQGDPLARLASAELEARVAAARALVAVLEADPEPSEASVNVARSELAALEAVLESRLHISSPSSGTVVWIGLSPAELVAPGDEVAGVRAGTGGTRAFSFVEPDLAARLSEGMGALVQPLGARPADADGEALHAVVAEVSRVQPEPPTWLARTGGISASSPGAAVVLDFEEPPPRAVDGDPCRVRITVGEERPIGLFAHAAPAGR